ncbi:MAG: type IV secretion system DNA-binding domain-containing protein [Chitinophagales bacterium]|nr:type IV secretion system DNA-binding domain-containing protein [Chitinophagales bacterium]
MYLLGQTGVGKSTMIKTLITQDIIHGRGCCLLEPHGDLVEQVLHSIPESERHRLVYIDATNHSCTLGYNPLRKVSYEKRALVAAGILDILKKLWEDAWGVKLEHILRYTLLALLDQPQANFQNILDMLQDKVYRNNALRYVESETVQDFWIKEFPKYMPYDLMPIYNKVGALLGYPIVRKLLIENTETISLRSVMDTGQILLINLSKGHLGADVSHILGALLVTAITTAAFSRVDTPLEKRVPFHIFLDEFHNYTSLSLVNMLSELRKFKIGMVLAHQYTKQLEPDIFHAIIGNVGTKVIFRVGHHDASIWAKEMKPLFSDTDFMELPNRHIYLTMMIDGVPSKGFSGVGI